jgi:hypothetical protein
MSDLQYNDVSTNQLLLNVQSATAPSLYDILRALTLRLPNMSIPELLKAFFITSHEEMTSFKQSEIFPVLRTRSGQTFGDDIDQWIDWFLQSSNIEYEQEKRTVGNLYKLYCVNQKALRRLKR